MLHPPAGIVQHLCALSGLSLACSICSLWGALVKRNSSPGTYENNTVVLTYQHSIWKRYENLVVSLRLCHLHYTGIAHCIALCRYCGSFFFFLIEDLQHPCIEQIYLCYFSSIISTLLLILTIFHILIILMLFQTFSLLLNLLWCLCWVIFQCYRNTLGLSRGLALFSNKVLFN